MRALQVDMELKTSRLSVNGASFPQLGPQLPKYSPDLNPFSKLAFLSKAAERTIPRLRRRTRTFARNLTASEARNCFRHAGYA